MGLDRGFQGRPFTNISAQPQAVPGKMEWGFQGRPFYIAAGNTPQTYNAAQMFMMF
jgi:hypothetical protein